MVGCRVVSSSMSCSIYWLQVDDGRIVGKVAVAERLRSRRGVFCLDIVCACLLLVAYLPPNACTLRANMRTSMVCLFCRYIVLLVTYSFAICDCLTSIACVRNVLVCFSVSLDFISENYLSLGASLCLRCACVSASAFAA